MALVEREQIRTEEVYQTAPRTCPACNFPGMIGIEVPWAPVAVVYWECARCRTRLLRYPEEETERLLAHAKREFYRIHDFDTFIEGMPTA